MTTTERPLLGVLSVGGLSELRRLQTSEYQRARNILNQERRQTAAQRRSDRIKGIRNEHRLVKVVEAALIAPKPWYSWLKGYEKACVNDDLYRAIDGRLFTTDGPVALQVKSSLGGAVSFWQRQRRQGDRGIQNIVFIIIIEQDTTDLQILLQLERAWAQWYKDPELRLIEDRPSYKAGVAQVDMYMYDQEVWRRSPTVE